MKRRFEYFTGEALRAILSSRSSIFSMLLVLLFGQIFGVIFLSDVDVLFKKFELSIIDDWHLLGGYLVSLLSYLLSQTNPRAGLLAIHYASFLIVCFVFFRIVGGGGFSLMVFCLGPFVLFSNIVYKDFFCYPIFLLLATNFWFIAPALLCLFKFEWVLLFYLLIPFRMLLGDRSSRRFREAAGAIGKSSLGFSILLLIFFFTINNYLQNSKSYIASDLLQSYEYGLRVLRGGTDSAARSRWLECREFEQERLEYNKEDLVASVKSLSLAAVEEPGRFVLVGLQKSQCAYLNVFRFGLTPSVTYGFDGELLDYLHAVLTQFSPVMKPLIAACVVILFARRISFLYMIIVALLLIFFLPLLRINQEFRYSIPIILMAQILVCAELNRWTRSRT